MLTEQCRQFATVSGGFIGSEIAAALSMNGKKVVMVFPQGGIGSRIFSADLSRFLNDSYRQRGAKCCRRTRGRL